METIKVKLINDQMKPNPQYKGLVHGIRSIVAQEGASPRSSAPRRAVRFRAVVGLGANRTPTPTHPHPRPSQILAALRKFSPRSLCP